MRINVESTVNSYCRGSANQSSRLVDPILFMEILECLWLRNRISGSSWCITGWLSSITQA